MNLSRPTTPPPERPPENLDRLLRAFFQAQTPAPWPAPPLPLPRSEAPPAPRRWWRWGSRSALAASVALLFLGYWSLAGVWPAWDRGGAGGEKEIAFPARVQRPLQPAPEEGPVQDPGKARPLRKEP